MLRCSPTGRVGPRRKRDPPKRGHSPQSRFLARSGSFYGTLCDLGTEVLAIQTEINYNRSMVALQLIVVATLVSVLYVYLRQSNQD